MADRDQSSDRWAFERRQDAVQALLGVLNDIGGGQLDNYNVITEAAEDAVDATGLVADVVRLRAALEKIAYPPNFLQSRSVLSTWAREALNGGEG